MIIRVGVALVTKADSLGAYWRALSSFREQQSTALHVSGLFVLGTESREDNFARKSITQGGIGAYP